MNTLCIDIGTSNIKFGFYQQDIQTFSQTIPVQSHQLEDGHTIQKPDQIIAIINDSIREMIAKHFDIDRISFSVPMHTLIHRNEMILWSDLRANDWVTQFKKDFPELAQQFYQRMGTPIHPMSPFAKIGYFIKVENQYLDYYHGLKEYLMNYYTGKFVVDYSTASATGLFNLTTMTWDEEILNFLGVNENQLATLVDTDYILPILPERTKALGLKADVEIHIGATDGCLASLAAFENENISQVLTIGTSGAARKIVTRPMVSTESKDIQNFCYYIRENQWVIGGPTNNGGNILEWLADLLFEDKGQLYQQLPYVLNEIAPGSEGLKIYPYLNGERAPLWDANAHGLIKGLRMKHTKQHFMKATVEGILFNLRMISNGLNLKGPISLNGGFFQIEGLVQLTANILQLPVSYTQASEPMDGLIALVNGGTHIKSEEQLIVYPEPMQTNNYDLVYKHWIEEVQ
ncbi:hypothetical protein HZY86_00055 [Aerococcaceae bacterium DSM 111020]|nr:hypothetical protein [Aerococcaceae bacterium DSM 111020]